MHLNETNQFIKDSFQDIIDGKFDGKLPPEHIKKMLQMSFLYNHITLELDAILFQYNGQKFRLKGINDMIHSIPYPLGEDEILSMIISEEVFKSCYASFLRNNKIEDILK